MTILETVQAYGKYREISPGVHAGPCPRCGGAVRFRISIDKNEGKCDSCEFTLSSAPEIRSTTGEFDAEKMRRLISETCSRVRSLCPKGAEAWLTEHRPEAVVHLVAAGKAVDVAYETGDESAVEKALKTWETFHLAAYRRYEERGGVIERQEPLFELPAIPAAE